MQVNEILLELKMEFRTRNNKECKVKVIINNAVYGKKTNNQMPNFYYLIL